METKPSCLQTFTVPALLRTFRAGLFQLLGLLLAFCALALLSGCQAAGGQPPAPTAAQKAPTAVATALPSTPTVTLAPSSTPPPTGTPTPASSPTPVSTPTVALPVKNGQALPALSLAPLSAANVKALVEVARYGNAKFLGYLLNDSGSVLLAINTDGFRLLDTARSQPLGKISANVPARTNTWINGRKASAAGLSADGKFVLALGAGDTLDLWQADGQKLASFEMGPAPEGQGNAAAVSANGALVAVSSCTGFSENGCAFTVRDWKANKDVFQGRGAVPLFSPDGRYFSINFDRSIDIYTIQDWKRIVQLPEPRVDMPGGWQKQFSPDGGMLATIEEKVINLWNVADRKLVRMINSFEPGSYADSLPKLVFSPDNRRVAVLPHYSGRKIIQVDVASGDQSSAEEYQAWMAYYFNASGSLAKFSVENAPTYPDVYNYMRPYFVFEPEPVLYTPSMQFFPDQGPKWVGEYRCRAGSCEENKFDSTTLRILHDSSGAEYRLKSTETKNQYLLEKNQQSLGALVGGEWNDLLAANQNMLLMASGNMNGGRPLLQVVDLQNGKALASWPTEVENAQLTQNWAVFLKPPPGARRNVSDFRLQVYDRASGKMLYDQPGYGLIAPVEQGQRVLLIDTGCVTMVDIAAKKAGKPVCDKPSAADRSISGQYETTAAVSPDGTLAAVGLGGGQIVLYDTASGNVITSWQAHMSEVLAIAFNQDGTRLASFANDGFVKVWAALQP